MEIKCIAIDDEPLALDVIQNFASKVPFLNLMALFENPLEAIDFINENKIDLIFLDVEMEELTGIGFLKLLNNKPHVIFTTAYEKYALQGFELEAVDYLLKPILFERFVKAAGKVHQKMLSDSVVLSDNKHIETKHDDYLFVKTGFQYQKVYYSDILFIKGQGDYLQIVTHNARIMTLQSFKKIMDLLPEEQFMRVHKSYIVAVRHIDIIERNRIKIGSEIIPVSESYGKKFIQLIRSKGLDS